MVPLESVFRSGTVPPTTTNRTGYPDGMAEGFVAEARRLARHMGCRSSSMAFPEVADGDHMGSTRR